MNTPQSQTPVSQYALCLDARSAADLQQPTGPKMGNSPEAVSASIRYPRFMLPRLV